MNVEYAYEGEALMEHRLNLQRPRRFIQPYSTSNADYDPEQYIHPSAKAKCLSKFSKAGKTARSHKAGKAPKAGKASKSGKQKPGKGDGTKPGKAAHCSKAGKAASVSSTSVSNAGGKNNYEKEFLHALYELASLDHQS